MKRLSLTDSESRQLEKLLVAQLTELQNAIKHSSMLVACSADHLTISTHQDRLEKAKKDYEEVSKILSKYDEAPCEKTLQEIKVGDRFRLKEECLTDYRNVFACYINSEMRNRDIHTVDNIYDYSETFHASNGYWYSANMVEFIEEE